MLAIIDLQLNMNLLISYHLYRSRVKPTSVMLMLANGLAFGALTQLVETKVGDLQHPAGGDHTIRGFEIAMIDQL